LYFPQIIVGQIFVNQDMGAALQKSAFASHHLRTNRTLEAVVIVATGVFG
jgi:hypothetical protein